MKCLATYPSYQEANERQLDLLAADIDAMVQYVPTGFDQVYWGSLPIYALVVPPEQIDDAFEVIRLIADEDHRCLFRCPKCDSNDVRERRLDEGFGSGPFSFTLTLGLVAIARMLIMMRLGRKFECLSCHAVYRKSP